MILIEWLPKYNAGELPTPSPALIIHAPSDDIIEGEIPVGDYEATLAALQEKVDASRFEVKCNSSISRDPETGKYNLLIGNTARNRYDCYVELISDDGALLYRSPILEPGQYIPEAALEDAITGKMDASAVFIIMDPKTYASMGKVVVAVTIHNQTEAGSK